MTEQNIRFRQR